MKKKRLNVNRILELSRVHRVSHPTYQGLHHVGLGVAQRLDGVEDVDHVLVLDHLQEDGAGTEGSAASPSVPEDEGQTLVTRGRRVTRATGSVRRYGRRRRLNDSSDQIKRKCMYRGTGSRDATPSAVPAVWFPDPYFIFTGNDDWFRNSISLNTP